MISKEGSLLIASVGMGSQTHVTCNYAQLAQAGRAGTGVVEEANRPVATASLQLGSQGEKPRSWFSKVAGVAREPCGGHLLSLPLPLPSPSPPPLRIPYRQFPF